MPASPGPDVLAPIEWGRTFRGRQRSQQSPSLTLYRALLDTARDATQLCACRHVCWPKCPTRRARWWVLNDQHWSSGCGFRDICELFGLDVDKTRRAYLTGTATSIPW